MKKTIAAWTIAAAAVFGLAACSSTSAETDTGADVESSASAPAEEEAPAGDQSVADACSIVQTKIQEASSAVSSIDVSSASEDPQGTVDAFTETVDGVGEAVESVSNPEVKDATSAVYDDFVALRDLLSKVLIDQDMEAAGEMATAATDVQTSAQELGTLCS